MEQRQEEPIYETFERDHFHPYFAAAAPARPQGRSGRSDFPGSGAEPQRTVKPEGPRREGVDFFMPF